MSVSDSEQEPNVYYTLVVEKVVLMHLIACVLDKIDDF